jgi:hypothetical protein
MRQDPDIITSCLSQAITEQGVTVELAIYRIVGEADWILEVRNPEGVSIVCDDLFPSDAAAYAEFRRMVDEEGMEAFLDDAAIIPLHD